MIHHESGGVVSWQFEALAQCERLVHGVTSRHGGVSPAPYDSLNLGLHVGDDAERVTVNRRRVCDALGLDFEHLTFGQQVHGDRVHAVNSVEAGRGRERFEDGLSGADGLIAREPGIAVGVFVADCVPLLLYDPARHVAAVVHAGWRGTAAGIASKTVTALRQESDVSPASLLAGVGPAIGPCCYEVSAEVARQVGVVEQRGGKWYADLARANRRQLLAEGLLVEHIELSGICTACHAEEFYSERRLGRPTGRFAAVAALR